MSWLSVFVERLLKPAAKARLNEYLDDVYDQFQSGSVKTLGEAEKEIVRLIQSQHSIPGTLRGLAVARVIGFVTEATKDDGGIERINYWVRAVRASINKW